MQVMQNRNIDRRLGMDRRCFSYDGCFPERRSGRDRRFKRIHETGKVIALDIPRDERKKSMNSVY